MALSSLHSSVESVEDLSHPLRLRIGHPSYSVYTLDRPQYEYPGHAAPLGESSGWALALGIEWYLAVCTVPLWVSSHMQHSICSHELRPATVSLSLITVRGL